MSPPCPCRSPLPAHLLSIPRRGMLSQQRHEIRGVFGGEGWQGEREGVARPPPVRGIPRRLRSCQILGKNEAEEETAHSSMYYFCLLRIIVFQAKENRRGGCYYKCLREGERAEPLRSRAFPSSEQSQAGEIPSPADSQGHRWSRKQTPAPARQPPGGLRPPRCPSGLVFAPDDARPGRGAAACTGVRAHRHAHACAHTARGTASHGRQTGGCWCISPMAGGSPGEGGHGYWHPGSSRQPVQPLHPGSARHGARPPACSCPSLLFLVPPLPHPSQPSACSRWFLWELGRKTWFLVRPAPAPAAQSQAASGPVARFASGTTVPGLAQEGRDPSPPPSPRGDSQGRG